MGAQAPGRVRVSEQEALLEVAVDAARMAGALLLERVQRGAERSVSAKSTPTDLVSEADLSSERAIRELLAERRPRDGFVGEEGTQEEGSSGLRWVVDPLDGTVNFLFGIPQWCVSVAVRDEQEVLAGAVYDPNRDELFTATRDGEPQLTGSRGTLELRHEAHAGPAARQGSAGGEGEGELATAMVATGLAYDAQVRGAQAKVLARLAPRCETSAAWAARRSTDVDRGRALRRVLRAHGQAVGHRSGCARVRTRGPARARAARARAPSLGDPGRAPGARGAAAGARGRPLIGAAVGGARGGDPRARARGDGAAGGNRTHTPFRTGPFEGPASTVPPPPQDGLRERGL